jgi:methenyltetrahydrofolate cyclohydrolase
MSPPMDAWLADLGSAKPTPGGGAAAATLVAISAALVEMVTNLTIGKPRYGEHEPLMRQVRDRAGDIRTRAQELAADDERAFAAVIAAYQIPRDDLGRSSAISQALTGAVLPPLRTAEFAAAVITLAGEILPGANVNVWSDVAVAASTASAGLAAAAVNVEVNLAAIGDSEISAAIADELAGYLKATDQASKILSQVRMSLRR